MSQSLTKVTNMKVVPTNTVVKKSQQAVIPLERAPVKQLQQGDYYTYKLCSNPADAKSPVYTCSWVDFSCSWIEQLSSTVSSKQRNRWLRPAYNKAGQKLQSLHHLADRLGWFCTRQSARDSERGNSGWRWTPYPRKTNRRKNNATGHGRTRTGQDRCDTTWHAEFTAGPHTTYQNTRMPHATKRRRTGAKS